MGEDEDSAFVVQCTNEFVPPQWQLERVTFLLPAQYFTVGIYSRCLNEWEKPSGTLEGCFQEVKIIHTTRGPKEVKEVDTPSPSSIVKRSYLDGTRIGAVGGRFTILWRASIAPASISKQCPFCMPNTSESVKHKFWDCIQTRRAWRWAIFIIHELCGVNTGNYDSFN